MFIELHCTFLDCKDILQNYTYIKKQKIQNYITLGDVSKQRFTTTLKHMHLTSARDPIKLFDCRVLYCIVLYVY